MGDSILYVLYIICVWYGHSALGDRVVWPVRASSSEFVVTRKGVASLAWSAWRRDLAVPSAQLVAEEVAHTRHSGST